MKIINHEDQQFRGSKDAKRFKKQGVRDLLIGLAEEIGTSGLASIKTGSIKWGEEEAVDAIKGAEEDVIHVIQGWRRVFDFGVQVSAGERDKSLVSLSGVILRLE